MSWSYLNNYTVKELQRKATNLKRDMRAFTPGTVRYKQRRNQLMQVLHIIEKKTKEPYSSRATRFVWSVISQRKQLLRNNCNRRNESLMREELERLKNRLDQGTYNNIQMAKFFRREGKVIYNLIPDTGKITRRQLMCENLINEANEIIKHEVLC